MDEYDYKRKRIVQYRFKNSGKTFATDTRVKNMTFGYFREFLST